MELITTYPVKKSDLGFHGNLFGGKLLSILDSAAVAYAMQLCDTPRMVTVSIDKCIFEKPTKEGQVLKIFGYPSAIGNTSVTLYMEARSHNVRTGKQNVVLKTHTKFVYIDEDGNPIPLKDKSVRRITEKLENIKVDEKN
ncbi:acyl-CoA thioesterase [Dolichospermum sp. ST_con]|nr:acyl-CoA thioesterase [Dolichospermum sp. ST_con]